jgi:hypothetical protein
MVIRLGGESRSGSITMVIELYSASLTFLNTTLLLMAPYYCNLLLALNSWDGRLTFCGALGDFLNLSVLSTLRSDYSDNGLEVETSFDDLYRRNTSLEVASDV